MKIRQLLLITTGLILAACGSKTEEPVLITKTITTDNGTSQNEEGVNTSWSPTFKHDEYLVEDSKGMILLCHRAGWSRGEYLEIAPKLNEMGFSCIAIDQRSGKEVNGVKNIVASMFDQDSTTYIDAIPDIEFAIERAYKKNNNEPIILWGSSYSSTLALLLGPPNDMVKAMVSFSPGDYFPEVGSTVENVQNTTKPIWITYSKTEYNEGGGSQFGEIGPEEFVTCFGPESGEGHHGSEALYAEYDTSEEYWASLTPFLESLK